MEEKAYGIANKARQILGGTLSANQCRDYVLALLFLKAASEYYKLNDVFKQEDGRPSLRLLVPEHSSFDYLCKELGSPELGKLINMALYELEQANGWVTEGYEINKAIDFESNILGETSARSGKLSELLRLLQGVMLTDSDGQLIDVGALYNELLYIFAEEAGKKINNVLAPKEVVSLMTKLIDDTREDACLCDPASGSGTLLVEAGKKMGVRGTDIYGQEGNWNLYALTKMNLLLNGFKGATFLWGDSLDTPKLVDRRELKQFDIVVSVPPLADKWAAEEADKDLYGRFRYGIPPKRQVAWAYISHILASLRDEGQAVVAVPVGVLFRNSESKIRERVIECNLLEAVIELPPNLFYGTAISTAILVFRKKRRTTQTLFVDARKGYISNKGLYKLSDKVMEQLLDIYKGFLAGDEVCEENGCPAYIATRDEIRNNKYDLKVIEYVGNKSEIEEFNVKAALQRMDELEKRLKFVDNQFEECAVQLRELTKEEYT